jgi:hypothetical protein
MNGIPLYFSLLNSTPETPSHFSPFSAAIIGTILATSVSILMQILILIQAVSLIT